MFMGFLGTAVAAMVFWFLWCQLYKKPEEERTRRAREDAYEAQEQARLAQQEVARAEDRAQESNKRSQCLALGHDWEPGDHGFGGQCRRCWVSEDDLDAEICRQTRGHEWVPDDNDDLQCKHCDTFRDLECIPGHTWRPDEYGDIKCTGKHCDLDPASHEHLMLCATVQIAQAKQEHESA